MPPKKPLHRKPARKRKLKKMPILVERPRYARYLQAADASATTLSEWVRQTLDAKCREMGIE
jgi:hypothetical protein